MHALDEERLVFFCGAGISMPHLPSFKGLTLEAMNAARVLDGKGLPRDLSLGEALREGLYDKVLDIIERQVQGNSGDLRRFVKARLTEPLAEGATLELHEALLHLARLRPGRDGLERGYRLVTTNFDDHFKPVFPI